jgi:type I restriction enzyme S subunit
MNLEHIKNHCPIGWQITNLGEVCAISNHLRFPVNLEQRQKMKGSYPYYGPTKVLGFINEYRVDGLFVLLSEDGDPFLKHQDTPMTLLVNGKFNVNNHAHLLQGTPACTTEWIFHFYKHVNFYPFITRQGAGRYKLTKDSLIKLPILLPPVNEQKQITQILFYWDRAIELMEKLIAAKSKLKRGLMQQLLTGKKRFPLFKNQKWKLIKLGDIFQERNELNFPHLELLSITSKNGVVKRDTLGKRDTSSQDKSKYLRILPGDIGYNTMRMWQGVSGLSEHEGIVSPAYTVCILSEEIDGKYASYIFKHKPMVHLFKRYSQGLVNDTLGLKFDSFAQIKILLPSIEEQRRIADVLNACDKGLTSSLRRSNYRKKG